MVNQVEGQQKSKSVISSEHAVLRENHLEAVLVEIRFSSNVELLESNVAFELQSTLAGLGIDLPKIEQAVQHEIAMTISGETVTPKSELRGRGWQLQSANGEFLITVMPSSLAIQLKNYQRWSVSMAPILGPVFEVINSNLSPDVAKRIGVRFINRMRKTDSDSPHSWKGSIEDCFFGNPRR